MATIYFCSYQEGISSIQVDASKGNQYTAGVHAEVHFTAEGAGYSVTGTIPDVLYTGASVAAANNMNDYKFPWWGAAILTRLESARFQLLKLTFANSLSHFAFNFNFDLCG
jgi:hypothetical protein